MGLWFSSDQISINIIVQRFFLSDSQSDILVQSEQSAQWVNHSIKAVSQSVSQFFSLIHGGLPQVHR